jgi:hypothetical protein
MFIKDIGEGRQTTVLDLDLEVFRIFTSAPVNSAIAE